MEVLGAQAWDAHILSSTVPLLGWPGSFPKLSVCSLLNS